ncbi:unnamed protein product [Meloidogyne enterolobii]|uniref:Uncharacterized protein n=1 Tax=Meloidogyne enterolobii TaxID=390850 RepID=A0ACB1ABP6_MELEN
MSTWRHIVRLHTESDVTEQRRLLDDRTSTWRRDKSFSRELHRRITGGRIQMVGSEQERSEYYKCEVSACSARTKLVVIVRTTPDDEDDVFIDGYRYYSVAAHTNHRPMSAEQMAEFDNPR